MKEFNGYEQNLKKKRNSFNNLLENLNLNSKC